MPSLASILSHPINVLDAGMGKDLKMRGIPIPETIWSANALLVAPDAVRDIHIENIQAGADVITTNSYGVIRADLRKEQIESDYQRLNELAGTLAQEAVASSGREVRIAGSLPPLNGSYRPDRVLPIEIIEPQYREQAEILAPFVDFFLCETMSHSIEALAAARGASSIGKPVIVSYTLHDSVPGKLRSEEPLEEAAARLEGLGVAGIMVNCCLPERISDAMETLTGLGYPFAGGYANAFTHVPADWSLDGKKESDGTLDLRDDLTPAVYAKFARDWITKGANLVGGCCGTTPAHTQALRSLVDE